jgi:hypothetical protein
MSLVIFLSGLSQGDTLGGIGRSFGTQFKALGYEFVEIKLTDHYDSIAALKNVLRERKPKFILSYMAVGLGMSIKINGQVENLWEATGIPFLTIFGDSPAYFFDRHVMPGTNFAGIYGFPDHLALRRKLPRTEGFVCTIPPVLVDELKREEIDFKGKQAGDVVFLKNGNDPGRLSKIWRETLPPAILQPLQDIASQLANNLNDATAGRIDDAVTSYFMDKDIEVVHLANLRLFLLAQLDDYIRRVKSTFMVRALLDLPIQVHGTNWDHIDFSGSRATWVTTCDFETSRQLIAESLCTLDMSPNTSLAPDDRVMRALGRYTMCLTNEQNFFKQEVPQHKSMTFRFEPHNLQAKVADIISRPHYHVELGQDIAETFRKTHPPEAAVGRFTEIAEFIQMNRMPALPSDYPEFFVWPPASLSSSL